MKKIILLTVLYSFVMYSSSQNVINFENDNPYLFIVNGNQTNKWIVGTATAYNSSKSAYISNNGSSNTYTVNSSSIVHLYFDVLATPEAKLYFRWKGLGEGNYDDLKVYLTELSTIPIAGTTPSGTLLGTYRGSSSWQQASVSIPLSNNRKRIVFTWRNDGSSGTQPPIAIDDIVLENAYSHGYCSCVPTSISLSTTNTIRWERSSNNGFTWDNIACTDFFYTEPNPPVGTYIYRALNGDGTYSNYAQITYSNAIPSTINTLPKVNTKTVDENITFTLEVEDDGYEYQWYKNDVAISGATTNTYTINNLKVSNEGNYHCMVWNGCNTTISEKSALTINKSPQSITFNEIPVKTYGDESFTLPTTTNKGLTITYQSTNTNVATVAGNVVTIKNPGSTNIIASQAGDQNYLLAPTVERPLTVNKQSQAITFNTLAAKKYGDPAFALPEKTDKGLVITYQSTNTQVATVAGNVLTVVNAGTADIIASQVGDTYRYAATPVTQTITVNQATQAITFLNFTAATYGDPNITLNQYSDAGLEIVYSSDNENVAKINKNIVELGNVGTAQITAKQVGNKNYKEAATIVRTLTINKANQTIVWDNIDPKTFGDEAFYLPLTTDKGLTITYTSNDESIAKVTANKVEIKKAGSATITGKQLGNSNYNPAVDVTLPINVSKAIQEITFTALGSKTYGDGTFVLNANNNSEIPIVYESSNTNVATISGNTVTIKGAGETYITASSAGSESFFSANPKQQLLTVNKAPQTISLDIIPDKTYGDASFTLYGQSSASLPVVYKSSDPGKLYISGNQATILGADTYTVTAQQEGTANYLPISTTGTFTVKKAQLVITADNKERFYGDDNPVLTCSYEGFKNGDSETDLKTQPVISCDADNLNITGQYDIRVENADDANYAFLYRNGKLNIKKASLTVKPHNETRKYGDKNPTFTLAYSGFKNNENTDALSEIPVAITNAKATSDVGEYDILVSGGAAINYELNYQTGKLTVEKATLTIAVQDIKREERHENPVFSLLFYDFKNNEDSGVLDELPVITCTANSNSPIGFYDIILSGGADKNYTYNLVNGMLEVTQYTSLNSPSTFSLSIYPVPANEYLYIASELPVERIEIYNQTGRVVLLDDNFTDRVDVSALPGGVYILRAYSDHSVSTHKVIIKR